MFLRLASVAAFVLMGSSVGFAQKPVAAPEALAKQYGCLDCHSRDKAVRGPSFCAIAANSKADVKGFDLAYVSVNSTADIPQERNSTVIVARVGEKMHVRIFDAAGRRVADSESNQTADAGLKGLWTNNNNLLPDSRTLNAENRRKVATMAAAAAGYTPANAREKLIQTVKKGGKGNWTHLAKGAPMPGFAGRMSDAEIARVVDWVLTDSGVPSLRVMTTGLGTGTISSNPAGISCGADCDETFAAGQVVTLTAAPAAGSDFVRWEGDATGSAASVAVTMDGPRSVRAIFKLSTAIPKLSDFTSGGIQTYLAANPTVKTPAQFLSALPDVYKQNWILMTRSESLQTGLANSPRILLPSPDSKSVFTIGLTQSDSYPGSHLNAVEYMQWDANEKNFRFHEIVLDAIPAMGNEIPDPAMPGTMKKTFPARDRGVVADDVKCSRCHSTRNVKNDSSFPGTSGVTPGTVKVKNKPNWDAYDSWAGMLPFNRDRIYQGTVEAAAFRSLMNLWTWRSNAPVREVIEQLELQPQFGTLPNGTIDPTPRTVPAQDAITRIVGGANDGHINFNFDDSPPVLMEPVPTGTETSIDTNYNFTGVLGSGPTSNVLRGGKFVLLHHTSDVTGTGIGVEGRGVQLFDTLGGADGNLNAIRVSDEIINHRFATGSVAIDVRPVALAIAAGLLRRDAGTNKVVGTSMLTADQVFFTERHGLSINDLFADTKGRSESVSRRKADLQRFNLHRLDDLYTAKPYVKDGLIQKYGGSTPTSLGTNVERLRQDVFRRPLDLGVNPGGDKVTKFFVDREDYTQNTESVTLYRFFLEPLGVSVDKWSMGVRGRSRTYSFADVFFSYTDRFTRELKQSLKDEPYPGIPDIITVGAGGNHDIDQAKLMLAVNTSLASLPAVNMVPKYTDVQRIFNKSCIECHGGLNYPPYNNFDSTGFIDFSENEKPLAGEDRLQRSHDRAYVYAAPAPAPENSTLYQRITNPSESCSVDGVDLMPCGGPGLSSTDIRTILRWINGGRPYTFGDPHLRTIDGIDYDFQAAGEFTYLRGENFELQVRQIGVSTQRPVGPNPHTGLTSCVSVNGAAALKLGRYRVSYQPGANGMELRVDGVLKTVPASGLPLPQVGRIVRAADTGGIQIELRGGTVIVLTPTFWEHFKLWYLNIDARNVRATEGLMGTIAPGNWLPAKPDGKELGARPEALIDRHKALYDDFGKSWRVTDKNSLFDYAPGTSTKSFTFENWPGFQAEKCEAPVVPGGPTPQKPPQEPIGKERANELALGIVDKTLRELAIVDIMATGEAGFAKAYRQADAIRQHKPPSAPLLDGPAENARTTDEATSLTWTKSTGKPGAKIGYKLFVWPMYEAQDEQKYIAVTDDDLKRDPRTITMPLPKLQAGKSYYWKVVAEDGEGGVVESQTRRFQLK